MPLAEGKENFKNTIKAFLEQQAENTDPEKEGTIDDFVEVLANATMTWITTNAVVVPTSLVAPPGSAGGPVTGTGTIQ